MGGQTQEINTGEDLWLCFPVTSFRVLQESQKAPQYLALMEVKRHQIFMEACVRCGSKAHTRSSCL